MSDEIKNEVIVEEADSGLRVDAYLVKINAYKSRSLAAKFCDNKKVWINSECSAKKTKVQAGDKVSYIPAFEDSEIVPQDIPLDIKFEDDDILVLSKQPGMVCHPAPGHNQGTLVNALLNHCGKEHLFDSGNDDSRLGIVHRLDGDTSGLMIVAKSQAAGEKLLQDMKEHITSRHYKALVYGKIKHNTGKISVPLIRTVNKRPKIKASNDPKAKEAITSFEVLDRFDSEFGNFTLLDCKIHTGRTHQIRAHMEYVNHPVVGDKLYNCGLSKDDDVSNLLNLDRQFLHSYKIGFNHPVTGEYLQFEDDIPKDLQKALDKILQKLR